MPLLMTSNWLLPTQINEFEFQDSLEWESWAGMYMSIGICTSGCQSNRKEVGSLSHKGGLQGGDWQLAL